MALQGRPVPAARACSFDSPSAELDQSQVGRLPGPADRHGAADRDRRSRSPSPLGVAIAVWLTEYGRPALARARGRVRRRGRRRHAEHRARDLRPDRSSSSSVFGFLSFTRRGRRGLRPLVHRRRGDDVADRAAADRRRHARGAAGDPAATCARRPTRSARRKAATIRRVLLPAARPAIAHRHRARHGPHRRRHRDRRDPARRARCSSRAAAACRSRHSSAAPARTLTTYVYNNSPAGEGNAPEKAYAAAFVLLLIVDRAQLRRRPASRGGREPAWSR